MPFIDLSTNLNESTPVYPGDPKITFKPAGILEKDGYQDSVITFGNHNGTHVDAPSHMIAGGRTLDSYPPQSFTGRGVLISVINKQFNLEAVKQTDIQEGDIVLFQTGLAESYGKPEYFEDYPAVPEEIAQYLVDKKVKMIGVDMCSVDHEPFEVHKILLKSDVLIIENLTNLGELKDKSFRVYAFPLKFTIDGSPTRVMAEILYNPHLGLTQVLFFR